MEERMKGKQDEDKSKPDQKKLYKQTRKLLRLAIAEGSYTQKQIAVKAGLSVKSTALVSKWVNGLALATERQMQYFINEYGGQLKRRNTHLFYTQIPNSVKNGFNFDYLKVEGEEVFSHKISTQLKVIPSGKLTPSKEPIKAYKIVILDTDNGYFLIQLKRAGLFEEKNIDGVDQIVDYKGYKDEWIHGDSENSNWFFEKTIECSNFDELVIEFHHCMDSLENFYNPRINKNICSIFDTEPVKFSFYHKFMKLGLQSEHLPF